MSDDERFESLYRQHAGTVLSYARRRTSAAVAEDVVAEVFLVAWRRLAEVPSCPRPWLLGVARRTLANQRRSGVRQDALRDRLAADHEVISPPADGIERPVLRALARLRESDRELLLLLAWEGLSTSEAAEVLGIRPRTLSVRLHRARRQLRVILESADSARFERPTVQEASR